MLSQKFLVGEFVFELNIEKKDMIYTLLSWFSTFAVQIKHASVATAKKMVALYITCIKFLMQKIP